MDSARIWPITSATVELLCYVEFGSIDSYVYELNTLILFQVNREFKREFMFKRGL